MVETGAISNELKKLLRHSSHSLAGLLGGRGQTAGRGPEAHRFNVVYFRNRGSIAVEDLNIMKG